MAMWEDTQPTWVGEKVCRNTSTSWRDGNRKSFRSENWPARKHSGGEGGSAAVLRRAKSIRTPVPVEAGVGVRQREEQEKHEE